MKKMPSLGDQEMEILRHVAGNSPVSVREVADVFEAEKGLARTTVLTVMERLRKKGYLKRSRISGVFRYSPRIEPEDVLSRKVSDFVERTLGGSVAPLLTYFISKSRLTDDEIEELKELAAKLDLGREG